MSYSRALFGSFASAPVAQQSTPEGGDLLLGHGLNLIELNHVPQTENARVGKADARHGFACEPPRFIEESELLLVKVLVERRIARVQEAP